MFSSMLYLRLLYDDIDYSFNLVHKTVFLQIFVFALLEKYHKE